MLIVFFENIFKTLFDISLPSITLSAICDVCDVTFRWSILTKTVEINRCSFLKSWCVASFNETHLTSSLIWRGGEFVLFWPIMMALGKENWPKKLLQAQIRSLFLAFSSLQTNIDIITLSLLRFLNGRLQKATCRYSELVSKMTIVAVLQVTSELRQSRVLISP